MPEMIRVLKYNPDGEVAWEYEGRVLRREPNAITLEALFNRPDTPFMGVVLKRGDRFVESFYSDRWYNVFEIFDRDDGGFKGWYCNVGKPAIFNKDIVSYIDLALDLWVAPDGTQTVLDQDEFEQLQLDSDTKKEALAALGQLRTEFRKKSPPA
jgi:uncharacterized protein